MALKKKSLKECKLYLILDAEVCDYGRLWDVLVAVDKVGVDIVQLRDKLRPAKETLFFAKKVQARLAGRIPFIVNDRVDIACLSRATGVHLGQGDLPVSEARKILKDRVIGVSCQGLGHLRRAFSDGADYVGFGSVFTTKTKPGRKPMKGFLLSAASREAERRGMPFFAIGGIRTTNLPFVRACGVGAVAVCRDILLSGDAVRAVQDLRMGLTAA
jgi:thiamine-phosphate diphosphorylase